MPLNSNNKLIVAAAGSGKTTFLVEEALKQKEGRILITTYTQANEAEIKRKIIEKNKCIPGNITVQTWLSFLLQHGAKPFQSVLFPELHMKSIKGVFFPFQDKQNKQINYSKKTAIGYYFSKDLRINSDKLSEFTVACNNGSNGWVIDRISRIYSYIFVDEVQDMAGYDLDFLKLLSECTSTVLFVGDPRQKTYSTNNAQKNQQYKDVFDYVERSANTNLTIDKEFLKINYRCNPAICNLSNALFPNLPQVESGNDDITGHDGVFLVKKKDIEVYLRAYNPTQLRYNKTTQVNENYQVMNFGESKGLTFDRVLIYPTKPFLDWLKNKNASLQETSRSKLYVAITRARYSVGIVSDEENMNENISQYFP